MHMQAVERTRLFQLVAAADPACRLECPDVRHYGSAQELVVDPTVQAVAILTPPNRHAALSIMALSAGKHVLVEKPVACSSVEVLHMAAASRAAERVLFTAMHARYRPEVREARRALLGETVTRIGITYKENVSHYHAPDSWVLNRDVAGGGVLADSGTNALSIAQFVAPGLPYQVTKSQLNVPPYRTVEMAAAVDFTFGENTSGHLSMDWLHPGAERREVVFRTKAGDCYTVDVCGPGQLRRNGGVLLQGPGRTQAGSYDMRGEYCGVYQDFAAHIRRGRSLVSMAELQFVEQAYTRAQT
jgi:predicted dehydrogenase